MSYFNGPKIVSNGLVLCLDAANPKSYVGSGTAWNDLSGNNNTGTLTNGPTYTSSFGGGIVFDGTNDYVDVTGNTDTRLQNNQQTISFWVNINSVGPNGEALIWGVSGGAAQTWIGWTPSGVNFWCGSNITSVSISSANNYSQWMNVTYIIDRLALTFKLYKNGVYVNVVSFTTYTASGTTVRIGSNSRTGNVGDYTNGTIGTTQIYNRALSASEILQNYNATKGRYGL